MADLVTAYASLKSMADWLKLVSKHKNDVELAQKASEYLPVIISLQTSVMQLQQEKSLVIEENLALKAQLAKLGEWANESAKYELTQVAPGAFVYLIQPADKDHQSVPWLCQACFEQHKKSVLQRKMEWEGGWAYSCPTCKVTIVA